VTAGTGFAADQGAGALGDHDRGRVGVAAGQARHHRGVDHAQAVHAAHAQLAVHHRAIVAAHAAGADRVIDGFRLAPDEVGVLGIGADPALGEYRRAAERRERRLVEDLARQPRGLDHHLQVVAFRVAQVIGVDRDRLCRVGRVQAQPAAAARMQVAGVHRVAVAGQAMAAVVVEQRGHEVELQVAAFVGGEAAAHEAAGLGHVGAARSVAMAQPAQAGGQFVEVVVAGLARVGVERADVQVVLQVGADAGHVGDHRDAVLAQVVGGAQPGQHQQLRRVDRARREDHLARLDPLGVVPAAAQLHADGAALLDQHAFDQRMRAHVQVFALTRGLQERRRAGAARAVALGHLVQPEAGLLLAVEVVVAREAGALGGIDQGFRQHVVMTQVGNAERTARAVPRVGAARVVLAVQEPWQHVAP
jgi:hypothetical protein